MHRNLARAATAALTATAVGATVVAVSLGGPASAHAHSRTMHFVAHDGQFAMDDLGQPSPQGPGIGDVVVLTQSLTRGGKPAGRVHDVAVAVDAKRHLFQANGSLVLSGGTIEYAGLVHQTPHFVMAITGGTGRYQGASGRIAFDFPDSRQLLTVTLKR
jgi:hypothetical protein